MKRKEVEILLIRPLLIDRKSAPRNGVASDRGNPRASDEMSGEASAKGNPERAAEAHE